MHIKRKETIQTIAQELKTFVGLYFHMGLVKMQSACSYWENETRYPPVADVIVADVIQVNIQSNRNFKIFADNYFSNLAMAGELAKRGFCDVGTITKKRLHGAPLKSEKKLKKEGRGSYHCVVWTTQNLSLVRFVGLTTDV